MLRSKRLEVVLSLEERKEQEALERLGEARKQVAAAPQQRTILTGIEWEQAVAR